MCRHGAGEAQCGGCAGLSAEGGGGEADASFENRGAFHRTARGQSGAVSGLLARESSMFRFDRVSIENDMLGRGKTTVRMTLPRFSNRARVVTMRRKQI